MNSVDLAEALIN